MIAKSEHETPTGEFSIERGSRDQQAVRKERGKSRLLTAWFLFRLSRHSIGRPFLADMFFPDRLSR